VLARQVLYYLSHAFSPLFALVILEIGSSFLFRLAWSYHRVKLLTSIVGMTGEHHHTQLFSVKMGSFKLFCLGWPETSFFPISASQVAKITGVSHCNLALPCFFMDYWCCPVF
jgi:hypothetical protein